MLERRINRNPYACYNKTIAAEAGYCLSPFYSKVQEGPIGLEEQDHTHIPHDTGYRHLLTSKKAFLKKAKRWKRS